MYMNIHTLIVLKVEVQDQGVGRFSFSTGLSPGHCSHGLLCVCILVSCPLLLRTQSYWIKASPLQAHLTLTASLKALFSNAVTVAGG